MKYYGIGVVIFGLAAGTVQAKVPVQWPAEEGGNGHWYQIVNGNGDSWYACRESALSQGGDLACITSEGENQFIRDLQIASGLCNASDTENARDREKMTPKMKRNFQQIKIAMDDYSDDKRFFPGGRWSPPGKDNPDGGWEWVSGEAWEYENWYPGEPNNGDSEERVLSLFGVDGCNGQWYDVDPYLGDSDAVSSFFIIEWDQTPTIQWRIEDGGNGHWYKIEHGNYTWQEAFDLATSAGGYLATLTSAEENEWVWEYAANPEGWGAHLGGYQDLEAPDYSEPDGGWRWVTGEEWSFTNWPSNQPDNANDQEHWLHFYSSTSSVWNDNSAGHPNNFIIEFTTLPGSALGACCLDGLCITTAAADCSGNSGSWGGPDSSCADFNCPESCPADVDGDGEVDIADLLTLIAAWGVCP